MRAARALDVEKRAWSLASWAKAVLTWSEEESLSDEGRYAVSRARKRTLRGGRRATGLSAYASVEAAAAAGVGVVVLTLMVDVTGPFQPSVAASTEACAPAILSL